MKDEKFFITPDMMPRIDVDLENIDYERISSKEFQKDFKKSKAYEKYVKPVLDKEKAQRNQVRKDWLKTNSWNLISTLIAIAALVISILK
jgi:hypothetical protein